MCDIKDSGFLNVNKPLNMTSHDVVARIRRPYRAATGSRKVGHAGTLDPLATGVLVLCLGKATRLSEYIMRGTKTYHARLTLGITTDSFDADGEVVDVCSPEKISLAEVESNLTSFVGEIQQLPPMYSAVKVGGRKLYELARQGETIELEPRTVRVESIDILSWDNPVLELAVRCGPGTYLRSLAQDLGQQLGVGAHLSALCRTRSGRFGLDKSIDLDQALADDSWLDQIIAPYEALADHPRIILSDSQIARIAHGRAITRGEDPESEQVFAFDEKKRLIAVLVADSNFWKPHKVFVAHP